MTDLHLIDHLPSAQVTAPSANYVGVQPITIGRDTQMSLFHHPCARTRFAPIVLGQRAVLRLGIGLKEACWTRVRAPVVFQVLLEDERQHACEMLRREVDVRTRAS